MLVLSRRENERINIGPDIQVVVLGIHGNRVRLGLVAPPQMPILREELHPRSEWTSLEEPNDATASTTGSTGGLK